MSDKSNNNEMMSISIDDFDVSELEMRIELATSTAACDCNGTCTGKCDSFTVKQSVGTDSSGNC